MAVQQTSGSTAAIQQILQQAFELGVEENYVYAQSPLSVVPPGGVVARGNNYSSLAIDFFHELPPNTSAISETADITPSTFNISQNTVTAAAYGDAVQLTKVLEFQSTPDVMNAARGVVARNAARVIDSLARTQAVSGNSVQFGGDSTARANVSPESTSDELAYSDFLDASAFLDAAPRLPGVGRGVGEGIAAITRKAIVADMIEDGVLILYGEQADADGSFLLNGEVGQHIAGVRVIESNFAKIFSGAGSSVAASSATVSADINAGDTSFTINSSNSSGAVGQYWTIGTAESTANGENLITEVVYIGGGVGTTSITNVVGAGANGGFKYAHSSGASVLHNYQVYTTVFLGMDALWKIHASDWGANGEVLPPEVNGILKQFNTMGWHWYGGFARSAENRLLRVEHAGSRFSLGD